MLGGRVVVTELALGTVVDAVLLALMEVVGGLTFGTESFRAFLTVSVGLFSV